MTSITLSDGRTIEMRPLTINAVRRVRRKHLGRARQGMAVAELATGIRPREWRELSHADQVAIEAAMTDPMTGLLIFEV